MTQTTNLELNKFDSADLLETTTRVGLNDNFDILDNAFSGITASIGTVEGEISTLQNTKADTTAVATALSTKANIDGYYESLSVGTADNLIDRKGNGTLHEFVRRTSCGDESITDDGTGVIQSIHGKTLVYNQLVDTDTESVTIPSGHKYYAKISGVESIGTSDGTAIAVTSGDKVCDLTKMFVSNEPSTVAEFHTLLDGDLPYNTGELINFMGMKSAGSVYDELTPDKAVTRIGKVDLGSLDWTKQTSSGGKVFFRTANEISEMIKCVDNTTAINILSSKYDTSTWNLTTNNADYDKVIGGGWSGKSYIAVADSSYSSGDETAFKTAMSGVILQYELATPTETPISPPLNLSYKVADFGTETVDDGNLITDGFNQYDNATGKAELIGGNQYQITGTYSTLSYSTGETITPNADGLFTPTESGTLTVTGGNNTNTCVHFTWSGYRNGEYEPYWKRTLDLCVDDYFTDDNPVSMPYAPFNAVIKYSMDYAREVPRLRTQVDDLLERVTALENA